MLAPSGGRGKLGGQSWDFFAFNFSGPLLTTPNQLPGAGGFHPGDSGPACLGVPDAPWVPSRRRSGWRGQGSPEVLWQVGLGVKFPRLLTCEGASEPWWFQYRQTRSLPSRALGTAQQARAVCKALCWETSAYLLTYRIMVQTQGIAAPAWEGSIKSMGLGPAA